MLGMVTFCVRCHSIKGHFTQKLRSLDHPDKLFFLHKVLSHKPRKQKKAYHIYKMDLTFFVLWASVDAILPSKNTL